MSDIGLNRNKKVVIAGAYGCGNAGDDAILAGLLKLFNPKLWHVTVFAADRPKIGTLENVTLIRQQLNLGFSWKVLRAFDFRGILRSIREAHILVIGGGALLHDLRIYNLPYFFGLHLWAILCGHPVAYLDIGVGPIRSFIGRHLCRWFLSRADHISVRDQTGVTWLLRAGVRRKVHVTADPAFMLTPGDVPDELDQTVSRENLPNSFIAVTLCGWFKSEDFWKKEALDHSSQISRTASVLDWLIEKTKRPLVFFPTVIPYDRELACRIADEMRHKDQFQWLQDDYPVEVLMGLLGRADWLFGMRLHSMILATVMQIPFFGIVYDEKVRQFMESIGNVHLVSMTELFENSIFPALETFIDGQSRKGFSDSPYPVHFRKRLRSDFYTIPVFRAKTGVISDHA
jgi:polysaccharide pyruvyl transferase CsaB